MSKRKATPGQLPMEFMVPQSDWQPPAELPDWRGRELALDTETRDDGLAHDRGPGWATGRGYVAGVGASVGPGESVYLPIRHPDTVNFDRDAIRSWLLDHVRAAPRRGVVMFNAHYDLGWLGTDLGVVVPDDRVADAAAAAVLTDENRLRGQYSLDAICGWRGLPGKQRDLIEGYAAAHGLDPRADIHRMPARYVGPYGEGDPEATLALWRNLAPTIAAEGLGQALELELDLVPVVVAMRRRGVRIDVDRALQVQTELRRRRDEVLAELTRQLAIGRAVTMDDVQSPIWLRKMHDAAGVVYPNTAPTKGHPSGQPSFSKTWMRGHEHWLPRLVDLAGKLHDAAEKFVGEYLLGFVHLGRIHADVHQYRSDDGGTRSYRFAYSSPPLQQMPMRDDEMAALIRGVFLPEAGEVWCANDYSQQEYRLIVHFAAACGMAGSERAVEAYRSDPSTDFHKYVVAITGLERKPAKDTNFAKAFGAGVPKFALMIGKTVEEAQAIYDQYDRELPFVSRLAEHCEARAQRRGWIRLLDGARSHFDDWEVAWLPRDKYVQGLRDSKPMSPCRREEADARVADTEHPWHRQRLRRADTRKAMNRLIQGSAARQTKLAMRECAREGLLPLLQMHDELDFSVFSPEQGARTAEIMRDVVKLSIPIKVDSEYGVNWGRAAMQKDKATGKVVYGATYEEAAAELAAAASMRD